jgi:hypothetical protein
MYNSSYNIIHRDSFCKNNHTSHKLKGLGIFQVDMVTTSQCHNKCHHGKWHLLRALYLYVLKLNFSKGIPGDTEICHSVSAADCVRRTLYTKMTTSSLDNVPFLACVSELSIIDCSFGFL